MRQVPTSTKVGRALVLVNFAVSVLFLGFASMSAYNKNDAKATLSARQNQVKDLEGRRDKLNERKTGLQDAVKNYQAALKDQIARDDQAAIAQQNKIDDLAKQVSLADDQRKTALGEVESLSKVQTERRKEVQSLKKARDELAKTESDQRTRIAQLRDEIAQTSIVVELSKSRFDAMTAQAREGGAEAAKR